MHEMDFTRKPQKKIINLIALHYNELVEKKLHRKMRICCMQNEKNSFTHENDFD